MTIIPVLRPAIFSALVAVALLATSVTSIDPDDLCPSVCKCRDIRNRDISDPSETQGKKVTCNGRPESKLTSLEAINAATLPPRTVQLILRNNALTEIKREAFAGLRNLKKLDLSRNQIRRIDDGAFRGLAALERLDLSQNDLTIVNGSTFDGLQKLERLSMNKNQLKSLPDGTFNALHNLKRVEFSSPVLWCDCEFLWFVKWMKASEARLPRSTKCAGPDDLADTAVRDLKRRHLHCNWPVKLKVFDVFPSKSQIVFQGDEIPFECKASLVDESTKVSWYRSGRPVVTNETAGVAVSVQPESTPSPAEQDRTVVLGLTLSNVDTDYSGVWSCVVQTSRGNVSKTVTIVVISDETVRCPTVTRSTKKGIFHWPKSVSGTRMEQVCPTGASLSYHGKPAPRAFYTCGEEGAWADLDISQCQYSMEITVVLEQYTQSPLNATTVLQTAMRLQQLIMRNYGKMKDKMDVVFISRIVSRLAAYIDTEDELVDAILGIVTLVTDMREDLLVEAQKEERSCSRLVQVIENIPSTLLARRNHVSYHSRGVAVIAYRLAPANYHGIQCWLDGPVMEQNETNFQCNALDSSRVLDTASAAITLPRNLLKDARIQHNLKGPLFNVQFIVYKNARLFPIITSSVGSEYEQRLMVETNVISAQISGARIGNLSEPVRVRLQVMAPSVKFWPVYWDFSANEGHGAWKTGGCTLDPVSDNVTTLYCSHLTNFAVMQVRGPVPLSLFLMEPVVYAGSLVLLVCLIATIATYVTCHRYIRIPKKVKHSLVNTCISLIVLVVLFTMATMRTDNVLACQIIGMVTHYFTVSTLFWITITSSNLYKKYYKAQKPPPPPDEIQEPVPPKPILRFYFVGWGVGLIVCGITAAVDLNKYSTPKFCFLTWETSLGALLGPVGMLLLVNLILFLCTSCILRPQPRRRRLRDNEIEMESRDHIDNCDSSTTSSVFDIEHKGHSQLRAIVVILFTYLFVWTCAAFIVAKPFDEVIPYRDLIFSYAYGLGASFLGLFILVYYCLSRNDARMCWNRFFCCRKQVLYEIPGSRSSSQATPSIGQRDVQQTMAIPRQNGNILVHQPPLSGAERSSIESGTLTNRSGRSGHSAPNGNTVATSIPAISHRSLRSHASGQPPQLAAQSQGYLTESSLNSSVLENPADVAYFYNVKQNTAAKRFWEKKHRRDVRGGLLRPTARDTDASSNGNRSSLERPIVEVQIEETPDQPSQTPSGHSLPPMPGHEHDSSPGSSLAFPPPPPPIALVSPIEPTQIRPKQQQQNNNNKQHCLKHPLESLPCERCAERKPRTDKGCYYSLDRGSPATGKSYRSSRDRSRDKSHDSDSQVSSRRREKRRSKGQWEDEFKNRPKRMHAFARRPDSRPYDSDYSQTSSRNFPRSISAYDQLTAYSTMDDASSSSSSSDGEEAYWLRKHGGSGGQRAGKRNHHHHHRNGTKAASSSRHRHHQQSNPKKKGVQSDDGKDDKNKVETCV